MLEIEELKAFLSRFARFESNMMGLKIEQDRLNLNVFFCQFDRFEELAFRFRESTAEYYNVFEIVGLSTMEAQLHTPYLADLLNPRGNHCQGRLFFDRILPSLTGKEEPLGNITDIEVAYEHHTPFGRIDILIRYNMGLQRRAIVIENKIYANDQVKQLERYYEYLSKILKLKDEQLLLVYLAPHRKKPAIPYSISKGLYERLRAIECLRSIGYREDLVNALEQILPYVKASVVAETLTQYIRTLKKL